VKLLLSSSSPVYSADLISALKALVSGLTPARPKPWKLCHIVTAGLAGRPDGDRSWRSESLRWCTDAVVALADGIR
jgi:hypothetical protein